MAKNLKSRLKNFFETMNNENTKDLENPAGEAELNESTHAAEALTDAHNPDLGTSESPVVEEVPINEEERLKRKLPTGRINTSGFLLTSTIPESGRSKKDRNC